MTCGHHSPFILYTGRHEAQGVYDVLSKERLVRSIPGSRPKDPASAEVQLYGPREDQGEIRDTIGHDTYPPELLQ
jgi:hypothetical protein